MAVRFLFGKLLRVLRGGSCEYAGLGGESADEGEYDEYGGDAIVKIEDA